MAAGRQLVQLDKKPKYSSKSQQKQILKKILHSRKATVIGQESVFFPKQGNLIITVNKFRGVFENSHSSFVIVRHRFLS